MTKCNEIDLATLLDQDAEQLGSSDHQKEAAQHLDFCQHCQDRIAAMAADDAQWNELRTWLSPCEGPDDMHAEYTSAGQRWNRGASWTQTMAQTLLGAPSHPEMLGRLGRYDIERLIGSGGMGVVFKAFDTELNRPVAVKVLVPYLAESGSARGRFAREAKAAAAVVDDHVVPIHNVESDDAEIPFLVMQYVAGGSLQQRIDRDGPLEVREVLRIGMQTAKGLAAAHAQGLIHRDVKPSNVLLDEGVDRALLTDFGLARTEDDACLTRSGFHPGTPHYMSPEQVRGEPIDPRSDLFGLGCLLYALCTGHPPFRAETSYAVLRRITDDEPRSIREINSGIPEWLERIVMRLLSKDRNARYDCATDLADQLEECLAHVQQPTVSPLPQSLVALAPKRGKLAGWGKWIAWASAAIALLLAGILIVLEFGKGTLEIRCDADGVPIRIMQGEKVVLDLTVSRSGNVTRIAAGRYRVEVQGDFEAMTVSNAAVSLNRGETKTVTITKKEPTQAAKNGLAASRIYNLTDFVDEDSSTPVVAQLDTMIELIRSPVEPDSWGEAEASIKPYPANKSLVVRHGDAVHRAIEEELKALRSLVEEVPNNERLEMGSMLGASDSELAWRIPSENSPANILREVERLEDSIKAMGLELRLGPQD